MKIIVIGAGLAGLVAADHLNRVGHQILVIEARDRVGGRVLTLRDGLSEGQYVDAGAEIVYGDQPLIPQICADFGISLSPLFPFVNSRRHLVFRGTLLAGEETATTVSELRSAFADHPPAPYESTAAWVRRVRMSENAVFLARAIAQSSPGGSMRMVDPLEVEKSLSHGAGFRKINGGNDLLPKAIAKTLDVRLADPARRIAWSRKGVTVETEMYSYDADRCVVAVPGPLTLELGFDPPLPPERVKAHLALRYGNASRIAVQYSEGASLRLRLGAGIFTDAMPASLHDQSAHLPGCAIVLSGIAGGDDEPLLESEDEVLQQVDKTLEHAIGQPVNRLFGGIINWTRDPWSRAVVRVPIGDQRTTVIPLLAAPLGDRLFFAGEHTDDRAVPGGMEGAAKSGRRVANEVLASG